MKSKTNIFMVEDDKNFGAVLKSYLEINGYLVEWVDDGFHAVDAFARSDFGICLLDVMLPNVDGFTIAKGIREINKDIPIIFLTAKTLKKDIVEGFNSGADDYITKPFDSEVLLLKINAILKRSRSVRDSKEGLKTFSIGKLTFDCTHRTISFVDTTTRLSPKESDLLRMLCIHQDEVLSREEALKRIWGDDNYFTTRSMDVYITKLRKYLKPDPSVEIVTIHGSGFCLRIN